MNNLNEHLNAPVKSQETIWIASFDIGHVNFAFYIEEINQNKLSQIKNIKKEERYNEDATPTIDMTKILNTVFKNGKTIIYKNSNISNNCVNGKQLDTETFYNMFDLLDKYSEYWDKCCSFIVEKQMDFGKMKRNPKALKLGHYCQSYFVFRYGRFKQVIEFPAYHKTQVLGCQKIKGKKYKNGKHKWTAINKPDRKKWSIIKATEILDIRGEKNIIDSIKTKAKKDDISDCICQLEAFLYLFYISKEI
jgi:hypothetical protein